MVGDLDYNCMDFWCNANNLSLVGSPVNLHHNSDRIHFWKYLSKNRIEFENPNEQFTVTSLSHFVSPQSGVVEMVLWPFKVLLFQYSGPVASHITSVPFYLLQVYTCKTTLTHQRLCVMTSLRQRCRESQEWW